MAQVVKLENVGILRLVKPHTFRQGHGVVSERDIEVPAGDYPVHVFVAADGRPTWVGASLRGVCVASRTGQQDGGKAMFYAFQAEAHAVASAVATGQDFLAASGAAILLDRTKLSIRGNEEPVHLTKARPAVRHSFLLECAKPLADLLREQREQNRQPLTEDHEVILDASVGHNTLYGVRLHAVDGRFKVVVIDNPLPNRANVLSVAEADDLSAARELFFDALDPYLTTFNLDYFKDRFDRAIEAWASQKGMALAV